MLNHKLLTLLQKHPNIEVYVRIGDEVFRVSHVYTGQVIDDCGRLIPWHGGYTYQPGQKSLAVFLDTDP